MNQKPLIPSNVANPKVQRVTKVIMHNLDGTKSEMRLTFPAVSLWGEMQEATYLYLSQLVEDWSRTFIRISGYEIHLGTIHQDGSETFSIQYHFVEIGANDMANDVHQETKPATYLLN